MSVFDRALSFVLLWEGGYSNHPDDPGGATNRGITQSTYNRWRKSKNLPEQDVRNITDDEVKAIYYEWYWKPLQVDDANPALAIIAFDSAVNHGVNQAKQWLQETTDWRVFAAKRLVFYTKIPTWPTFGRGWARRLAACIQLCAQLDAPRRLFVNGVHIGTVDRMSYVSDKLYINVIR